MKYNGLKNSMAGKLRDHIQLLEFTPTSDVYIEIDSTLRTKEVFDIVKGLLSMFVLVREESYALKYEYTSEWDQIANDIRWLDLYEARYHMDSPLKNNVHLSTKMYDL